MKEIEIVFLELKEEKSILIWGFPEKLHLIWNDGLYKGKLLRGGVNAGVQRRLSGFAHERSVQRLVLRLGHHLHVGGREWNGQLQRMPEEQKHV